MPNKKNFHAIYFCLLSTTLLPFATSQGHADPIIPTAIVFSTPTAANDLTSLSLDQLASMQVTSVSRKPQKASAAAAAIFVITTEDIRRSGATSIPEALRIAPGVEVARINSSEWSIGIRGFDSRLSRAVLVLIDGRSVYSPLFSGTYWEDQDTLLEDIDRIEVIRGPGGTLWGDNAVNGVINIITKNSKDTQGTYLTAGAGSQEKAFGAMRYGGAVGDNFHYRFYGKDSDRGAEFSPTGDNFDAWHMAQTGFRTDWDASASNNVTVQGDLYDGKQGERSTIASVTPPYAQAIERDGNLFGANLLSRWKHQLDGGSDMSFQTYYDHTDRKDPNLYESRNNVDADFQHHIPVNRFNDFIWGFEYRYTANQTNTPVPTYSYDPTGRAETLLSTFVQDDISLIEHLLTLTLGSKFEHNDFSGWEYQPNGRLAYTPDDKQTLWTAVSKAVRTPSDVDRDVSQSASTSQTSPVFSQTNGEPTFESEEVVAYEAGYRIQPIRPWFLDVDTFYDHYDRLQSLEPGAGVMETIDGQSVMVYPRAYENGLKGQTHGLEFSSTYVVTKQWTLRGNYSFLSMNLTQTGGSNDTVTAPATDASSPRNQVTLQSLLALPHGFEIDPTARYVDARASSTNLIPTYWTCDLHLGWHVTPNVELSLVGQNLLQPEHFEFGTSQEIERSLYGQVTYRSW